MEEAVHVKQLREDRACTYVALLRGFRFSPQTPAGTSPADAPDSGGEAAGDQRLTVLLLPPIHCTAEDTRPTAPTWSTLQAARQPSCPRERQEGCSLQPAELDMFFHPK